MCLKYFKFEIGIELTGLNFEKIKQFLNLLNMKTHNFCKWPFFQQKYFKIELLIYLTFSFYGFFSSKNFAKYRSTSYFYKNPKS
jgi:hypothetical protein